MLTQREKPDFRPANILLVDDDLAILRLLSHLLEQEGHKTRTASDGNMALQYILQDCPDVIITDWQMPGIDGLELCRRVRQLHHCRVLKHYCYILLLSSQTGKKNLLEGLDSGADDFVEKGGGDISDLRVELLIRLKAALRTREMEQDLEYAAKYDALTSLVNRCTFFEEGTQICDKIRTDDKPLSAVMLDCDFFKRINDLYGHQAGDLVLETLAAILKRHSRGYDLICRYGGEEFCALLPGCDEKVAFQWTERIRKQLESMIIPYEQKELKITASFGIAQWAADVMNLDELVERADQALLFAKESGRNKSIKYSEMLLDHESNNSYNHLMNHLFEGVTAGDVMTQIVMTIPIDETVAHAADFFLKAKMDSLAIVDDDGTFAGLISEKTFLSLIGDVKRWNEPIRDMVTENVITYTTDTPLKVIYNFLSRVSVRRVIILKEQKPLGIISRNLLLRWLRNGWAIQLQNSEGIIPDHYDSSIAAGELRTRFDHLLEEMQSLQRTLQEYENPAPPVAHSTEFVHHELITKISKSQEMIDEILMCTVGHLNSFASADSAEEMNAFFTRGLW